VKQTASRDLPRLTVPIRTGTRLAWNLDLIPLGAFIVVASMAD